VCLSVSSRVAARRPCPARLSAVTIYITRVFISTSIYMYESKSDRFLSLLSRVAYRTLAMRPRPPSKPRAGNDGTKKRDYSHAGVILLRYIKKERSDFTKRAKDQARKQQQQQPLGTRQDRQIGRVIYVSQSQRTAGPSILYPSGQTFLFIICLIFV
jgi:hypothetical protein